MSQPGGLSIDFEIWACPICLSPLREAGEALHCVSQGHSFPRRGGLAILVHPDEAGLLQDSEDYARAWKNDEWSPPAGRVSELPYVGGPVWSQKARSLDALKALLGPAGGRSVADVGAGTG